MIYSIISLHPRQGKAYVCSLTAEEMRAYRGTLTEPGRESPDRARPAAESLALFAAMRAGQHPDGALTLRAKWVVRGVHIYICIYIYIYR